MISRDDVARRVAERTGATLGQVRMVLNAILDVQAESFATGEEILFETFGVYRVKEIPHRRAYDFDTKQEIWLPPTTVVQFRPAKALAKRVRDGAAARRRASKHAAARADQHVAAAESA